MLKWKIGDVTVTSVLESQMPIDCTMLFPKSTREEIAAIPWLTPHFINDECEALLCVQSLVVETPSTRLVVDTCVGNDKRRSAMGNMLKTDFLERLSAAGFPRESIDTVMCTHLHIDHVGWNTMLVDGRWVPTFPRARYLIARTEFDYWKDRNDGDDAAIFGDSVQPVFDAGLADLVDTAHHICDEVQLIPTPGHTPGHVSVAISSRGEEALITGDMMHHPSQIARPDWAAFVDYDANASTHTRKSILADFADRPVLVIGTHFAAPTAGHIVRDGDSYRFEV